MNLRTIFWVLVLCSFSIIGHASEENPYVTKIINMEVDNGKAWVFLDHATKIGYIKGLELGMIVGASTVLQKLQLLSDKDKDEASKGLDEMVPKGPYTEVVNYIDGIYKNPSYRVLPIIDVFIYMGFEQNGKVNNNNRDEYLQKWVDGYKK